MGNFAAPRTVTVSTTATLLGSNDPTIKSRRIRNNGAASIFIGGSTVTTSGGTKGWEVAAGATDTIEGSAALYGIIAAATADVTVWEINY